MRTGVEEAPIKDSDTRRRALTEAALSVWPSSTGARERLAAELHKLRRRAGLSGYALAARLGTSQSRVSRAESGKASLSTAELDAWIRETAASETDRARLRELADAALTEITNFRASSQDGRTVQDNIGILEVSCSEIYDFSTYCIPGLLQTPEYAEQIFTATAIPRDISVETVASNVAKRMKRKHVLYDPSKHFEFIITETALRWMTGSPELLIAQLDRISVALTLPNVQIGLIPLDRQVPIPLIDSFRFYGGISSPEAIFVETLVSEITIKDPTVVTAYCEAFALLRNVALYGGEAQAFLALITNKIRKLTVSPPSFQQ